MLLAAEHIQKLGSKQHEEAWEDVVWLPQAGFDNCCFQLSIQMAQAPSQVRVADLLSNALPIVTGEEQASRAVSVCLFKFVSHSWAQECGELRSQRENTLHLLWEMVLV